MLLLSPRSVVLSVKVSAHFIPCPATSCQRLGAAAAFVAIFETGLLGKCCKVSFCCVCKLSRLVASHVVGGDSTNLPFVFCIPIESDRVAFSPVPVLSLSERNKG